MGEFIKKKTKKQLEKMVEGKMSDEKKKSIRKYLSPIFGE